MVGDCEWWEVAVKVMMVVCDKCSKTQAGTYTITYDCETWSVDLCGSCSSVLHSRRERRPSGKAKGPPKTRFPVIELPDDPEKIHSE